MSISRIQAIESDNNVPKVDIDSTKNNIPKYPVDLEGGSEPIDLRTLTISSNDTHFKYNVVGDYAWNKVVGDVHPIIGYLEATENGVYNASDEPYSFYGFSKVIVNVPPVEPTTKIISEFDFSQSEYDLIRSMPNDDPLLRALLKGYTYNATYDNVNGVISWVNGYGSWSPNYYLEPFKDYDIEIDMGTFDSTTSLAGTKQIIGLCKDGTNGLRFCWNVSNGFFQIINDSGTVNLPTLTDLSIISNAKILIKSRWSISTINYDPVCNVTIILNRDTPNSVEISFGRIDKDYAYELRVGRITSQNGIFPYSIKKCKITEYKWTPSI